MPHRCYQYPISHRPLASLVFIAAVAMARAQMPDADSPLPSAPQPQQQAVAVVAPFAFSQQEDLEGKQAITPSPVPEQADPAMVTMLPHAENGRYWISGQANIIFQGRLPFHSLYQGPNSFRNSAEYKTSLVGTLFTAVRPTRSVRYNTDLILDIESAAGRGLSEALGLAGFTNLDVVRNPNLGSAPYLARYQVHQVIGFTQETAEQYSGPLALAANVPVRRLEMIDRWSLASTGQPLHRRDRTTSVI